jgi:MoaA/NifB/PqqE/SkfB family radical SAM enzyme
MRDLVALQHKKSEFRNITKVEWFIGLLCNFSCTYCAEWARSGFGETEKILRGVDLLHSRVAPRQLMLLLGGGEPSIHPGIEKIVEYIASKGIYLSMISNGSRSPELYTKMLRYVRNYTFSVHFEQKYQNTLKTIVAVHNEIKRLNELEPNRKRYMQANVMMAAGHFDEAKKVIELLEAEGVNYIIRRIRPLYDKENKPILPEKAGDRETSVRSNNDANSFRSDNGYYNESELEFLNSRLFTVDQNTEEFWHSDELGEESKLSNSNDVSIRKLNRFEGWKCFIGIERLHVYPTGDVYRSTCKVGGKLGNIYDDFEFPKDPVTCTKDRCTCAWAINVSKAKSDRFEKLLRINR